MKPLSKYRTYTCDCCKVIDPEVRRSLKRGEKNIAKKAIERQTLDARLERGSDAR